MASMRSKVDLDLSGLANIASNLKRRALAKKAVTKAARVVQQAVKSLVPTRQGGGGGSLKQAQGVKAAAGTKGDTLAFAVQGAARRWFKTITFPGRKKATKVVPAFYDHLVDAGTQPHSIKKGSKIGRKGKASTGQSGGLHPGTKAARFREQAWSTVKGRAGEEGMAVLAQGILDAMAKEAARLGGKK